MLLIVGLGNPGRRYAGNRHNIGFMAADEIHRRHRFSAWRARFEGELSEGMLDGEKAQVLKPATYMNESGRSVGQAMRFFKLQPSDVVVLYDELDLPPGKLRIKTGGGTAGHKGLKSIEAHIGKEFRRMRIGIGHPGAKELVNGYVLHDFPKADREWIDPLLAAIAEHAPLLAKAEDASFMNRVHLAVAGQGESGADRKQPQQDAATSPASGPSAPWAAPWPTA
jgi:PTH1 family peptidyl-tRNA hydrolase